MALITLKIVRASDGSVERRELQKEKLKKKQKYSNNEKKKKKKKKNRISLQGVNFKQHTNWSALPHASLPDVFTRFP